MSESSFPATLDRLDEMIAFILDFAERQGLNPGAAYKVRLAAEEVLVNIVKHAYPDGPGTIGIACAPAEGAAGIAIEIKDTGLPFNPLEKSDPDTALPMEERPIGGLGIFLVKKVMDDIGYVRDGDTNILRLVKHAS